MLTKNIGRFKRPPKRQRGGRRVITEIKVKNSNKALIYCRVSSERQKNEGSGLESQEHRCRQYADQKGYEVERSFLDSFTGGGDFMKRPAMVELLDYIDSKPHNSYVVIFDDLSRLARDVSAHISLRIAFKNRGATVECPNFNFTDTDESELVEMVLAAQNQYHRKANKRQVVQKMKARLEAGYWPFGGKKGYKIVKDPAYGKICRPNAEGKILAEALEMFANRTFVRRIDVCRFLVEKGFWKKQSPGKYIDRLTQIMQDPFYCGDISYPVWEVARRQGQHKGIIIRDTFDRIQKLLKKENSSKRIRWDISPIFPLRGLIICDHCKSSLTAGLSKKVFAYYVCHTKTCERYGKSIRRKDIEDQFLELLQKNTLKSEIGVLVDVVFERVWKQEINIIKAEEADSMSQVQELEKKAEQLTEAVLNAQSPQLKRIYENQLKNVAIKIEEKDIQPVTQTDLSIPYRTALSKATELLKNPHRIWQSLDVVEQHRLFYFIFEEKLSYNQKTGYRTNETPHAIRLFKEFAVENTHDVEMAGIEPACKKFLD